MTTALETPKENNTATKTNETETRTGTLAFGKYSYTEATIYRFKSCGKCGGDLKLDLDEWSCFQCGHIYYLERSATELELLLEDVKTSTSSQDSDGPGSSNHKRRITARRLDPSIVASRLDEKAWWSKNHQVIHLLDQGKKVQEIAAIVGKGDRQIRVVRERLRDLRSAAPDSVVVG